MTSLATSQDFTEDLEPQSQPQEANNPFSDAAVNPFAGLDNDSTTDDDGGVSISVASTISESPLASPLSRKSSNPFNFAQDVDEDSSTSALSSPDIRSSKSSMSGPTPTPSPTPRSMTMMTPPPRDQKPPTRQGYLVKQSGSQLLGGKWDKRWFELSEAGFLHYFKKQDGKNAGSIFLKGSPVRMDKNDKSMIRIDTGGRTYVIKASANGEADAWFKDISYYSNL
eukprot:m.100347 g.100347  ORF g.100347 m.100347 type:complete len:225 (+) comp27239_c0_seq3:1390-2064(+)